MAWVKAFRIIPEFRILRVTFHRVSLKMLNLADFNSFSDLTKLTVKILMRRLITSSGLPLFANVCPNLPERFRIVVGEPLHVCDVYHFM